MKTTILTLIATLAFAYSAHSQFDLLGNITNDLTIRNTLNPSQTMDSTIVIGLPSIFNSNRYKGIAYSDVFSTSIEGTEINALSAINNAEITNHYQTYAELQGLSLNISTNSLTISTGYNIKLIGQAEYSGELVRLALQGNAQYLDQQLSIGPSFGLRAYHEVYLGLAKTIGKLSIGARVKLLSGIEDLSTSSNQIKLTTDSEFYALQFDNNYQINSSGVLEFNDLSDFNVDFDAIRYSGLTANKGYGLDLGLTYDINDRWSISASALDMGMIHWTKRAFNYTSNDTYTYDGVDLVELIMDSDNYDLKDTLYNILQVETTENDYKTALASRYYISTLYNVDATQTVGVSAYMINHDGPDQWALAFQYRKQIGKLYLSGQYAYINKNPFNIGAGIGYDLGWLKLNAYSDNFLGLADMQNSRSSNFRLGASIHI